MIEIRIKGFETHIAFEEGKVNTLEIHDKKLFSECVYNFIKSTSTKVYNNEYMLIKDEKIIDMYSTVLVVQDFYQIDFNTSKIIKKIYERLQEDYEGEFNDLEKIKYWKPLFEITKDLIMEYPFEFEFKSKINFSDWLKLIGLKFDADYYDRPIANLMTLFEINSTLKLFDVIVLINVKSYFEPEELQEVYKMALYNEVKLLLIEHYPNKLIKSYEKKLIIDCDFDEQMIE